MTDDEERWAEAATVFRQQGGGARVFVAARIGALVAAHDHAGVRRWTQVAAKLDQIMRATVQ